MKICVVLVLSFLSVAFAQETFTFSKNGKVCVKATFDAVFELSFTDGNKTYFANFSLPAESKIDVDGSCGNISTLQLDMTSKGSRLVFTFETKDDNVTADLQFVLYNASEVFENLNYTSAVSFTGPDEEFSNMGTVNNSYLCNALENVTLTSNEPDINASVTILYTNLQIQAFNFNDKFSNPYECDADANSTSTSTSTVSTTMMTTTLPTPTGTGRYSLTVDNDTCALMVANISVSVNYMNQQGKEVMREVMVPADANVTGSCAENEINMTLHIADQEEATGTLTFIFENDRGYTLLKESAFSFSFNDTNTTVETSSQTEEAFSLSSLYFRCDEQIIQMGKKDQVILQDLKVQAFNLSDGNFSTECLDCHRRVPETAPTQNYTVVSGNTTCISMSAALTLEVKYMMKNNKNETVILNFEKEEPATGSCSSMGNGKEEITIKYKQNNFQITFEFGRDGTTTTTGLGDGSFNYYVENVLIDYNLGFELFPNATDPTKKSAKVVNQTLYKTGSDKYYKCSAEDTLKVDDWVSLKTKDLRFVAFNTDAKEPNLFGDNINECTADTVTNSIVPIAVGAALAGLVVIVLIAYLIGRRRNHKGYESV